MCNPYDNNPFKTDNTRDSRSEYDANRALANTIADVHGTAMHYWKHEAENDWYNRGYALGMATALSYVEIDLKARTNSMTPRLVDLLEV